METKEKAQKLHKKVHTFFLSCINEEGFPVTKAVVPGKIRNSLKELYFCTNTSSKFVQAIRKNSKSSVYFYSKKLLWKGCLLLGTMEVIEDEGLKAKFWQEKFKNAYKEKSYCDPDFCLLKFTSVSGRFYANFKPEDFEIV